jgi:catechol 2,3-dioxygenase-like lactoylglutathione lyase family enzyme
MKRFHVHVAVPNLQEGIRFYSTMFGADPSVTKPDYAKWMLEDPRVNFAISLGAKPGVNHLGFQVDSDAELGAVHERLQAAASSVVEERNTSCCYARSDKYWVKDPAGLAWESFHTLGAAVMDGEEPAAKSPKAACGTAESGCCA